MSYVVLGIFLLLIAGYALYVSRLFCFAFSQAWKKASKPPRAAVRLAYVLTNDTDDCDFDLLWHTQQPALEFLRAAGGDGASMARMTELYRKISLAYPELFEGSNFPDWLEALQQAGVAVHCRSQARVAITEKGRLLLDGLERRSNWTYS